MFVWMSAAAGLAAVTGAAWLAHHRAGRRRLYGELARARRRLVAEQPACLRAGLDVAALAGDFDRERIASVPEVLGAESLAGLRAEVLANRALLERSFIPLHKQGGTVSYERVQKHLPRCLAVFHSAQLGEAVSGLVGAPVLPTADHDQSACSVLYYTEEGDRIGWHYDHNFYRGRHFTVLLSLVNEAPGGGASGSELVYRDRRGGVHTLPTPPNSLVVFEGARIRHRVTPLGRGELRVVLSMTYSTDPRIARGRELLRRVKDTGFYGLRALWD